jgi:hypothetical protein
LRRAELVALLLSGEVPKEERELHPSVWEGTAGDGPAVEAVSDRHLKLCKGADLYGAE